MKISNMPLNPFFKHATRLLAVLGLTLLMASCTTRFFYNQLDWMLPWYIDDYVTVQSHQTPQLDQQIDQFLSWHRTHQLPPYARFLQTLAGLVKTGASEQQIEPLLDDLDVMIDALYLGAGQHFVPLLRTLEPEQKKELIQNLTQKNIDYAHDYINIGEAAAREKGAQKMIDIFSDWLGSLSEDQVQMIQRFAQTTRWMSPQLLHARQRWTQALSQSLSKATTDASEQNLLRLFANRKLFWRPHLKSQYAENKALLSALLSQLITSLTPQQRRHLLDKLAEYRTDFMVLSQQ
jgi:hypothetical protein